MIRLFRDLFEFRRAKEILDLQARLDEKDRLIDVLKAENESLAGVIARDRQRIKAETAAYSRQIAEAESNERATNGVR